MILTFFVVVFITNAIALGYERMRYNKLFEQFSINCIAINDTYIKMLKEKDLEILKQRNDFIEELNKIEKSFQTYDKKIKTTKKKR